MMQKKRIQEINGNVFIMTEDGIKERRATIEELLFDIILNLSHLIKLMKGGAKK